MRYVLLLVVVVMLAGCGESRESSAEYQRLVYEHMELVTDDPEIDAIRVDGSLLYINFIKRQPESEYLLVAECNTIRFSNFKRAQLGVSHVTVFVTYSGRTVAEAGASGGRVTSSKSM